MRRWKSCRRSCSSLILTTGRRFGSYLSGVWNDDITVEQSVLCQKASREDLTGFSKSYKSMLKCFTNSDRWDMVNEMLRASVQSVDWPVEIDLDVCAVQHMCAWAIKMLLSMIEIMWVTILFLCLQLQPLSLRSCISNSQPARYVIGCLVLVFFDFCMVFNYFFVVVEMINWTVAWPRSWRS